MTRLRVASYNLHGFRDDTAAAARIVRVIDPDVLCLQEAPRFLLTGSLISGFADRCRMVWSGDRPSRCGTTLLTSLRVDVRRSAAHLLPLPRGQEHRGFALAEIAPAGGRSVHVVSVHLSLRPQDRRAHIDYLLRTLATISPVVIAGDLNETASDPNWQRLAATYPAVSTDAMTFPAVGPNTRIDGIFASRELAVAPHRTVGLDAEDLRTATDHLPIWVDLDVARA